MARHAWREKLDAIGAMQPSVAHLAKLLSHGSYVTNAARHELVQVGHELKLLRDLRAAVEADHRHSIDHAALVLTEWYERTGREPSR